MAAAVARGRNGGRIGVNSDGYGMQYDEFALTNYSVSQNIDTQDVLLMQNMLQVGGDAAGCSIGLLSLTLLRPNSFKKLLKMIKRRTPFIIIISYISLHLSAVALFEKVAFLLHNAAVVFCSRDWSSTPKIPMKLQKKT